MRLTDFTVEGSGDFPWDMLRYDECWPQGTADAHALALPGRREVRLRSYSSHAPTEGRWASFNWIVKEWS